MSLGLLPHPIIQNFILFYFFNFESWVLLYLFIYFYFYRIIVSYISCNLFIYFLLISNFHCTTFYLFIYLILISNFHYWILSTFYFLFFGYIWIMGESRIIVSSHHSNYVHPLHPSFSHSMHIHHHLLLHPLLFFYFIYDNSSF